MKSPLEILLVEDNPGDARLLREFLREAGLAGASLHHFQTLGAACDHIAVQSPDVILLDLSLPDAHGLETVHAALAAAPAVPIVVLTGLDDEAIAVHAVQAGAQDYLVKGRVDGASLGRSLRYAIERAQLAREREEALLREKEARERAEAAVRARDHVLRVVSHDLGNHLAAIRVNARVLTRTIAIPAESDANLERGEGILQQVDAMERLRQDLLDVASIEAGRLSISPERVDPGEVLRAVAEYVEPLTVGHSIRLTARPAPDLPWIQADPDRLRQALGNLVGNAIKFSPGGGAISLEAELIGDEVVFAVSDQGPGVAPEDAGRIFESFWKGSTGIQGAGLGLSIVLGIAQAHGGRVWFEPRDPLGSTFRLAVPVA